MQANMVQNYLTNRRQFVDYNKSHSQLGNITAGVPQGSILGPLLFLLMLMIYIMFLNKFHVFNMLMTPLYMPVVKIYQM